MHRVSLDLVLTDLAFPRITMGWHPLSVGWMRIILQAAPWPHWV